MLKSPLFMFFANFIFLVSHLKLHPAVHVNTSNVLTLLESKNIRPNFFIAYKKIFKRNKFTFKKVIFRNLLALIILMF